jgi:hypothetical protein
VSTQQYSINPQPIQTILSWVTADQIAIPEIQRPFVWETSKVRDLLDSLYKGFPVGYLIAWQNPDVKLKDGSSSVGKRILIDGQQRVTALMAALLGTPVINKDYEEIHIKIAFHPIEEKFEVANSAILKDKGWIPDVSELFKAEANLFEVSRIYTDQNEGVEQNTVFDTLNRVKMIAFNTVGIIDLDHSLDIETVTEIFIRVNSAGATLTQADFAMSKIAANENYGGNTLRKAIDYFSHLAVNPGFEKVILKNDKTFAATDYFKKMKWLADTNEDLYDPSYTDMLRVAFTSQFERARLQDLVALLSGRNFETRTYEEAIAEQSFASLSDGIMQFMSKTNFERFIMIVRSSGLELPSMIGSKNLINFSYVIYLYGRRTGVKANLLEDSVRKWLVMSLLTGRAVGNPETMFDTDIRGMRDVGLIKYVNSVTESTLNKSFWETLLPQSLATSSSASPFWAAFKAAQIKANDKGFLSTEIDVRSLLLLRGDVHHIYPRNYLKKQGAKAPQYNQIANFVVTQSEINIAIGDQQPSMYFAQLKDQASGGIKRYGSIETMDRLIENMNSNAMPVSLLEGELRYEDFLTERRVLMANKIQSYFDSLSLVNID